MAAEKVDISRAMAALDKKNREFYDALSDDEKKGFSAFMMLRWGSNVSGSADLQSYYLMATNERLNKNFFDVNKHPKLQWLMASSISPDMGLQRHNWMSGPKKQSGNTKLGEFIASLFPSAKQNELLLLEKLNGVETWQEVAEEIGMDKAAIKKLFS